MDRGGVWGTGPDIEDFISEPCSPRSDKEPLGEGRQLVGTGQQPGVCVGVCWRGQQAESCRVAEDLVSPSSGVGSYTPRLGDMPRQKQNQMQSGAAGGPCSEVPWGRPALLTSLQLARSQASCAGWNPAETGTKCCPAFPSEHKDAWPLLAMDNP
jgi:hypothetical protein